MNFKLITLVLMLAIFLTSCGDSKKKDTPKTPVTKTEVKKEPVKKMETTIAAVVDELMKPTLDNKGIGPIKNVKLGAIDDAMVEKGKALFKINCTACHKIKKKYIGPPLKDITKRRSPEWIMNMILNSDEMLKKDPVAKALIAKYTAPMAQQQISKEDVRAILEYLRTK
jgi:mono/diheme cytochrome c family protein